MSHQERCTPVLCGSALAVGLATVLLASAPAAQDDAVRSMRVVEDRGTFTYYNNEEEIGTSTSVWKGDGTFENEALIVMMGQRLESSVKVEVDEEGHWTTIEMQSLRGPVRFTRTGAKVEVEHAGKKDSLELKPGTVLMEDMSPALMSQAIAAYDHDAGGVQSLPTLFLPGLLLDGTLEYLETFERFVDDKHQVFRRYLYNLPGVYSIRVVVDEAGRVCYAEYPEQHGVFTREGYDTLAVAKKADALLSKAEYEVVLEKNVGVPMRDGIELATDVYRPDAEGEFPVILVRTPYKKEMGDLQARFYGRRGYVFAIQDVRGRFASPGEWKPFRHEADDGFDAIEWLAEREWSNGKVGMIGASYLGWVQFFAASRKPPHLVTMIPNVAPPEPYFNFPYEAGGFFLAGALTWTMIVENEATADLSGLSFEGALGVLEDDKIESLPVIDLDKAFLGREVPYWREWLAHSSLDDYWRKLDFIEAMKGLDIPVYHQSGWFDGDGIGSKLNYLGLAGNGYENQKLVLGPWGHRDTDTRSGPHGIDFGPKAIIDLQTSYLRWMDRWLKGIENGIDEEPAVSLFVMGTNDWLEGETYPLEGTVMTPYYLSGGEGDGGILTTEVPTGEAATPDEYAYDPGDPTPANPEGRKDLLVYTTPPATEPLTIAGPVSVVLHASSSAKDTDWFVRFAKRRKDGNPAYLGRGLIRARYRESFSEPKLLEPDEIYEYHIDLWQTGMRIDEGEQLIVVVSSALFPVFSRNLNTGGHNETETEFVTAHQIIYHDDEHPSHVLLPVIPRPKYGRR